LQVLKLHKQPEIAVQIGKEFPLKHLLSSIMEFGTFSRHRQIHFWADPTFTENDMADVVGTLDNQSNCIVVIVLMNHTSQQTIVSPDPSIHVMKDLTGAFLDYFKSLKSPGSLVMGLRPDGSTSYFTPSVGHPHFITLAKADFFLRVPQELNPMLHQKVELSEILDSSVRYMRQSREILSMPEVLIIHFWAAYCEMSQKNWHLYEKLRAILPDYTHALVHLNGREYVGDPDTLLGDCHPDMVLIDDTNSYIRRFSNRCQLRVIPSTMIFVRGRLEYAGMQHINCEPLFFPTLIEKALRRES
jgi:hypothetical protein